MSHSQEPHKWRELLGIIISNVNEKQRLTRILQLQPHVLMHWVYGEASPTAQELRRLQAAVPEHYELLSPHIQEALAYLIKVGPTHNDIQIPQAFLDRINDLRTIEVPALRFELIGRTVLQEILAHLDPQRVGIRFSITRCMPPALNGSVRSLRECMMIVTKHGYCQIHYDQRLVGLESVAGFAVEIGRPFAIEHIADHPQFLHKDDTDAISFAAAPIIAHGSVAGCLQAACAQEGYFTPQRLLLLQRYTDLLLPAFALNEFYAPYQIMLHTMPSAAEQQRYLPHYRQRVQALMREALLRNSPLELMQAEQQVWQQFEEEFLQLFS